MSIMIGSYNFEGPYESAGDLREQSGVYAILGRSSDSERWKVVDIGESETVQSRVSGHDRSPCWHGQNHRTLAAAAHYVPDRQRMQIERELRGQFNPPCGER